MGNWTKQNGLTATDRRIAHFLWRWKFAPTAVVLKAICPDRSPWTVYKRLHAMAKQGYLSQASVNKNASRFVWFLEQPGFDAIREELPLKEVGFRSEYVDHDFWVSAIHLGHWLEGNPDVLLFSEQQLRRFSEAAYPEWIPKTTRHRPDGYWRVPYKNKMITIALEVELNPKKGTSYQVVAKFYADYPSTDVVVWIVKNSWQASAIRKHLNKIDPMASERHNFFLLHDIEKLGWWAPAFNGCLKSRPLIRILDWTSKTPESLEVMWFLDGSKTARSLKSYEKSQKLSGPDSLANMAIPTIQHTPFQNKPNNERNDECIAKQS